MDRRRNQLAYRTLPVCKEGRNEGQRSVADQSRGARRRYKYCTKAVWLEMDASVGSLWWWFKPRTATGFSGVGRAGLSNARVENCYVHFGSCASAMVLQKTHRVEDRMKSQPFLFLPFPDLKAWEKCMFTVWHSRRPLTTVRAKDWRSNL